MESLHKPTLHHEAVVAAVLDAGADGGLPSDDGVTPLIVAAQEGHGGVVRLLLQAGVEASVTAANGDSAVEAAVRNGHSTICEAPLGYPPLAAAAAAAAPRGLSLASGRALLFQAAGALSPGCVSALLAGGADPNYTGKGNTTPLMYASQEGRADNVATLLAGGADLNASDDEGTTPLLYASRKSADEAVVTALLAAGAGVDAHEDDGRTPLFEAACHGVLAIARAQLAAGADVHRTCTPSKAVPLHLAAQEEAVEMVALLLEAGASVDVADATDETPIFFAARKDHPAVVDALVVASAAVDAHNAVGGTATPLQPPLLGRCGRCSLRAPMWHARL